MMRRFLSLFFVVFMLFSLCSFSILTVYGEEEEIDEHIAASLEALDEKLETLLEEEAAPDKIGALYLKYMLNYIKLNDMVTAESYKEQAIGMLQTNGNVKYVDYIRDIENNFNAVKAEMGNKLGTGAYANLQNISANISTLTGMDSESVAKSDMVKVLLIIVILFVVVIVFLKAVVIKK